ncbi:transposase [Nostoc sp. MG11]|uniref:transposase n=1 Tax=Nostoc sp. MG11 TaxID=2721166 RepID=UPI0029FF4742|nr:transposase [Nostoc sp. MG11]
MNHPPMILMYTVSNFSAGRTSRNAPYRHVLNSLLYILITGCRWCDLPHGDVWASKSSSHRWLKRWRDDGTFEYIQARILAMPCGGLRLR